MSLSSSVCPSDCSSLRTVTHEVLRCPVAGGFFSLDDRGVLPFDADVVQPPPVKTGLFTPVRVSSPGLNGHPPFSCHSLTLHTPPTFRSLFLFPGKR